MSKVRKTRVINRNDNNNSKLCRFGYVDYIVLASSLAVAISDEVSITDISILSTFFAVLSDELALIGSVKSCHENSSDNVFVPPVPDTDTAITRSKKKTKKIKKIKKIKKTI